MEEEEYILYSSLLHLSLLVVRHTNLSSSLLKMENIKVFRPDGELGVNEKDVVRGLIETRQEVAAVLLAGNFHI